MLEENRIWYLKTYENLITKALTRGLDKTKLDYYTELHHIVPKCMWLDGENVKSNQCLLTAREHIIAHLLLVHMNPDNKLLKIAVSAMFIVPKELLNVQDKSRSEAISKISTSTISYFRELASKARVGKKHSPETIEKLKVKAKENGKKRVGTHLSEKTIEKMKISHKKRLETESVEVRKKKYGWSKGIKQSEDWINKRVKSLKKSMIGKKDSEKTKLNKSKSQLDRIKSNPGKYSMVIIDPEGREFYSRAECARFYNVQSETIKRWIEKYPEKGFKIKQ